MSDFTREVLLSYAQVGIGDPAQILPDLQLQSADGEPLKALFWATVEPRAGMPPKQKVVVMILDTKAQKAILDGLTAGVVLATPADLALVRNGGK